MQKTYTSSGPQITPSDKVCTHKHTHSHTLTHTHTQPHTLTSQPLRGARYSTVMRRAVENSFFITLYWSHALKRRDKVRTHTRTHTHTLTSQPLRGARYSTVMRRAVGNSFASQSEGQQCLCLAAGQSQENCKLCVSLMCNRLVGENNLVPASQKANNACV